MSEQLPEVFAAFQCAVCQAGNPIWSSSNHAESLFGSPGRLTCQRCTTVFPVRNGYLDLHPGAPEPVPPIQHLMQFPPIVAVYEGLWRPIGYFIASKHSFPKDVDRIASLIQRRHGIILDLAWPRQLHATHRAPGSGIYRGWLRSLSTNAGTGRQADG